MVAYIMLIIVKIYHVLVIHVNAQHFSWEYFTSISRPPPVLLFLLGNSRNLNGSDLVK